MNTLGRYYSLFGFVGIALGVFIFIFDLNMGEITLSPGENLPLILKIAPFIAVVGLALFIIMHLIYIKKREKKETTKIFSYLVYLLGIVAPLAIIPQVFLIWFYQDASSVSILSWSLFSVAAFSWLGYGILHKEKPLILSYSLWFVLDLIVVFSILFV